MIQEVYEWHNQDSRISKKPLEVACTLNTNAGGREGHLVLENSGGGTELEEVKWVVRRLTPKECERLQGYPDDWTDIEGASDTKRYKAMGNSIALPQWQALFERMKPTFDHQPTLGSLFDGVGGFPLTFERVYGTGTARWAAEIEPFPIAVTKKRFPEKEKTDERD